MDISALASIIGVAAVQTLYRYYIRTVEALLARAQDEQGRAGLSRLLGLTEEQTTAVLKEAQALVPEFDPTRKYPAVGKGALRPYFKER